MTKRVGLMHASLAAIALALTACGGEKAKAPDSAAPTAGAAASNAPGKDKITIAMIAKSSTNPVFLAARTGAERAAAEISQKEGIQVTVDWLTPPQEDGQVQAQRIQQAVNDGADAILISCSDAGKVTGAINDAVARGVAVMTFDSDAPQSQPAAGASWPLEHFARSHRPPGGHGVFWCGADSHSPCSSVITLQNRRPKRGSANSGVSVTSWWRPWPAGRAREAVQAPRGRSAA